MDALARVLSLLALPRCAACGASCGGVALLCGRCEQALESARPPNCPALPGVDSAWAAAPHDGVARELVAALKFRGLLPVAELIAGRIAAAAPRPLLSGAVVPVPPACYRLLRRGFDPAEEIASRLAASLGLRHRRCLARADGPRQVGRSRASRLASPPRVRAVEAAPAAALLVDDVQTTGATLCSSARALRDAGAQRVIAITFARTV